MKHAQSLLYHLKLTFCTLTISFAEILIGSSFVFASTILKQLRESSSSTINLNTEESSWITSVSVLVCPIGLIMTGILSDRIGRRKTVQIAYIPMILSWLILMFAETYKQILFGRALIGITFGVGTSIFLYIAEVCPANLRSLHSSMCSLNVGIGMLVECVLSAYIDWQTMSAIFCATSVAVFVVLFLVPEPSLWLMSKGSHEKAFLVDEWFGGVPERAAHDDVEPSATVAAAATIDDDRVRDKSAAVELTPQRLSSSSSYWWLYTRPTVWRPALITVVLFACQQGSGVYVLLFYSMDVLQDCGVRLDGTSVTVFLSAARVLGALCFAALHRVAHRTLLAVSGASMAFFLLVIVAYMKTFENVDDPPYPITVVVAFVLFVFFSLLGILPIPWILCGEVFPTAVSGVMNGVVQTIGYLIWFAICKIYPSLIIQFGVKWIWTIFAVFSGLNAVLAVFIIPETKGKSLNEILSNFECGK